MKAGAVRLRARTFVRGRNFYNLEEKVPRYYGYKYLTPKRQRRGTKHILSRSLIRDRDVVLGNMYFTATRLHQELAGGGNHQIFRREAARAPASPTPISNPTLTKSCSTYASRMVVG